MRIRKHRILPHHARETEVAQLHIIFVIEKNVAGLEVAVQDLALFARVAGLESQKDLAENDPYHVLRQILLLLPGILDERADIAALAVLHYNVDFCGAAINYAIVVFDNVGVVELAEDVDFTHQHLLLLFRHLSIIKLLPNKCFAIGSAPYQGDPTKRPLANVLDFFILFKLLRNLLLSRP